MKQIIREVLLSDDGGFTQRHEISTPDGFSGSIRKKGKEVPVRYDVDSEVWAQEEMSQQEIEERVGSAERTFDETSIKQKDTLCHRCPEHFRA